MVVLQQQHVKNVTIMAKFMHKISQGLVEKIYHINIGRNVKAVLPNLPAENQIHARNLKSPAEKDLVYITCR